MKSNYKKLGQYIRVISKRNKDLKINKLIGLSIQKMFMPPKPIFSMWRYLAKPPRSGEQKIQMKQAISATLPMSRNWNQYFVLKAKADWGS